MGARDQLPIPYRKVNIYGYNRCGARIGDNRSARGLAQLCPKGGAEVVDEHPHIITQCVLQSQQPYPKLHVSIAASLVVYHLN